MLQVGDTIKCHDKEDMVNTHSGILLRHKKDTLPFATTWVHLEGIVSA